MSLIIIIKFKITFLCFVGFLYLAVLGVLDKLHSFINAEDVFMTL